MNILFKVIEPELRHYQKLSLEGQQLLQSYFLYYLVNPLLWTFASAFLWRQTHDILLVAIYNIAVFFGLPFGFYINGKLLSRFNSVQLYRFGLVAQGVAFVFLVFFSTDEKIAVPLGLLFGITSGFFWSNKAFLTIFATKSYMRVYFSSLEQIFSTITSIIIPLGIGWFIIWGSNFNLYSSVVAYQILGLCFLSVLFFAGCRVKRIRIENTQFTKVTIRTKCKRWIQMRCTIFSLGMSNGIETVVPLLMVLVLMGKEGTLGTIQSLSGVFLALAMYHLAKKVQKHQRIYVLTIGVLLSILSGLVFSVYYSAFGVILYFILNAFAGGFRWSTFNPISFDAIVGEEKYHSKHRYRFIFDQQLWLNLGRNVSLISFLLIYLHFGTEIALRFTPLLFALPQLCVVWMVGNVEKDMIKDEVNEEQALLFHYAFRQQFYKD